MEIYLLREEQQLGPYEPEALRSWLHEGNVLPTELAWAKGMEEWVPLDKILTFEPAPAAPAEPEREPAPEPMLQRPILKPVPKASGKQKAFLSYMGASFTANLNEDQANHLVTQIAKDRKLAARLTRWENDRLDLHPEMFQEEIEARRANRPAYFHKLVQTDGGDCFNGVTKAHCQVLVTYLDVNHPRWDANLTDAAWHYFFPAINEKFPQLVNKEWRPKLKYKDGPRVAAELLVREDGDGDSAGRLPIGKIVRSFVLILVLCGLAGAGFYGWKHPEAIPASVKESVAAWRAQAAAIIRGDDPAPVKKPEAKKVAAAPAVAGEKSADAAPRPAPDGAAPKPPEDGETPKTASTDSAPMKPADGAMAETKPPEPVVMTTPIEPKAEAAPAPMAPAEQPKPTEALFNPNGNIPPAPSVAGVPAAPAAARADVHVTRPIQIPSKYGIVTIAAGTPLKVVARDGDFITLNYMGQPLRVPVNSTDFSNQ